MIPSLGKHAIILAGFALVIAATLPGSARPGHQSLGVSSYTGCVDNPSGTGEVYNLQAGDAPASSCNAGDTEIHVSGGDITRVSPGTGLAGDTTNGDATLSIATSYRLPQNCSAGYVAGWNGSQWSCAVDHVMDRPELPAPNGIETVDTANLVKYTSVTIGGDDLPVISYYLNGDLKVAHCGKVTCTDVTFETLDTAGDVGSYTSIAIGGTSRPFPVIAYNDETNQDLKLALCGDLTCTQPNAIFRTIDSAVFGRMPSIAIGSDGFPIISYYDFTNTDLKVAHCGDSTCTLANLTITILDSIGDVGRHSSIAIGADGLPLISYYDLTNRDLKAVHCADAACNLFPVQPVTPDTSGDVGTFTSLTIGTDGLGLIAYADTTNSDLKVAHCYDVNCSAAKITTLDAIPNLWVKFITVTIGQDGLGLISYNPSKNASEGDLKVAHCADAECSAATTRTADADPSGDRGEYAALTIGADGLGLISYKAGLGSGPLKVLHCANLFCVPHFRRR